MKRIAAILMAAVLVGCSAVADLGQESVYHQARAATYALVVDKTKAFCSSVLVADEVVVTAAHCVDAEQIPMDRASVRGKDGKNYVFTVKFKSVASDVAVLSVPGLKGITAPIAPFDAKQDEYAIVVGYPLGSRQYVTEGRIQGKYTSEEMERTLATPAIIFGNSGGPLLVYRNQRWEVVGIASAMPCIPVGYGGQCINHMGLYATWQSVVDAVHAKAQ